MLYFYTEISNFDTLIDFIYKQTYNTTTVSFNSYISFMLFSWFMKNRKISPKLSIY